MTSQDVDVASGLPIIFMRDVKFKELECLLEFIYTGTVDVEAENLASFTKLAKELGLKTLSEPQPPTCQPFKQNSEPAELPSYDTPDTSSIKRRRMQQCRSLDDDVENKITPPSPFKTANFLKRRKPSTPLSPLVLSSLWSNAPLSALDSPMVTPKKTVPTTPPSHVSHLSCPVEQSPREGGANASNFSFDNSNLTLLDPNDLAAKGATLLHHLAVWMLEEKKLNEEKQNETKTEEPVPSTSGSQAGLLKVPTEPVRRPRPSGRSLREGSECDRPDSGFDSKDEEEVKSGGSDSTARQSHFQQMSQAISEESIQARTASSCGEESSSPDVSEISRQAPIRQPFRKRRFNLN